jgi:hypothetical protein
MSGEWDIIYKYTDSKGAEKILSNRNVRFTRTSEMNDPFDVYIDDLYGMNIDEVFDDTNNKLFDAVLNHKPEVLKLFEVEDMEKMKALSQKMKSFPDAFHTEAKQFLRHASAQSNPYTEVLKESKIVFEEQFSNCGLFCATKNKINVIMWAHYAEKHHGAVLGFLPNAQNYTFLHLMKPVSYSSERPYIIQGALDSLQNQNSMGIAEFISQQLLHTKSKEWAYEEEWRCAVPNEIRDGENDHLVSFIPNELVEIYFGVRMPETKKTSLLSLARQVNPSIKAYVMSLEKRGYGLTYNEIL